MSCVLNHGPQILHSWPLSLMLNYLRKKGPYNPAKSAIQQRKMPGSRAS